MPLARAHKVEQTKQVNKKNRAIARFFYVKKVAVAN
jgi:hypothetical protein